MTWKSTLLLNMLSSTYFARWSNHHALCCFLQHDEKSSSEQHSEKHWKDVATLLWHGQLEAFSEQELVTVAKSLRTTCPDDVVNFLDTGEMKSLE